MFGNVEESILEREQSGVWSSKGMEWGFHLKHRLEHVEEKQKEEVVERHSDFQKACDNVNHAFLEELLDVYGFPLGIQGLTVEMMSRWKIRLSYWAKNGC